jgi:hypothetical protein
MRALRAAAFAVSSARTCRPGSGRPGADAVHCGFLQPHRAGCRSHLAIGECSITAPIGWRYRAARSDRASGSRSSVSNCRLDRFQGEMALGQFPQAVGTVELSPARRFAIVSARGAFAAAWPHARPAADCIYLVDVGGREHERGQHRCAAGAASAPYQVGERDRRGSRCEIAADRRRRRSASAARSLAERERD